jgi:hypothetical protein
VPLALSLATDCLAVLTSSADTEGTGLEPEPRAKAVIPPSCGPTFPSAILARHVRRSPQLAGFERGWASKRRLCTNTVSEEDHALRAVPYHSGADLVTDWPALFVRHRFRIVDRRDIIADTIDTWDRVRAVYEQRSVEAAHRYGHRLALRVRAQIVLIPRFMSRSPSSSFTSGRWISE